jgi:hypothetical protein
MHSLQLLKKDSASSSKLLPHLPTNNKLKAWRQMSIREVLSKTMKNIRIDGAMR